MADPGKCLFRVIHPNHGEQEVTASDRQSAIAEAAKEWGLRWHTIAEKCRVLQLGPVKKK